MPGQRVARSGVSCEEACLRQARAAEVLGFYVSNATARRGSWSTGALAASAQGRWTRLEPGCRVTVARMCVLKVRGNFPAASQSVWGAASGSWKANLR